MADLNLKMRTTSFIKSIDGDFYTKEYVNLDQRETILEIKIRKGYNMDYF